MSAAVDEKHQATHGEASAERFVTCPPGGHCQEHQKVDGRQKWGIGYTAVKYEIKWLHY